MMERGRQTLSLFILGFGEALSTTCRPVLSFSINFFQTNKRGIALEQKSFMFGHGITLVIYFVNDLVWGLQLYFALANFKIHVRFPKHIPFGNEKE